MDKSLIRTIGTILEYYKNNPDKKELYAKAILINTKIGFGDVFLLEDFINEVEDEMFIDEDGIGYRLDENGTEMHMINCNIEYLEKLKEKGCVYIAWYNK